jgi:hypothetical protein
VDGDPSSRANRYASLSRDAFATTRTSQRASCGPAGSNHPVAALPIVRGDIVYVDLAGVIGVEKQKPRYRGECAFGTKCRYRYAVPHSAIRRPGRTSTPVHRKDRAANPASVTLAHTASWRRVASERVE